MPNPSTIAAEEELLFTDPLAYTRGSEDGGADLTKSFIYIAGPMSGCPNFNFSEFHRMAALLRAQGYNICNPAEIDYEIERARYEAGAENGQHDLEFYNKCLRRDLSIILLDTCVGIFTLTNWRESPGATKEVQVARWFGIPIYGLVEVNPNGRGATLVELVDGQLP